jgi:hypothetical protein
MRRWRAAALALSIAAGCSERSDQRSKCERLLDHVADLRLQGVTTVGAQGDPERIMSAHRAALKRSLGDDFIASCEQMTGAEVDCGLTARDHAALLACSTLAKK